MRLTTPDCQTEIHSDAEGRVTCIVQTVLGHTYVTQYAYGEDGAVTVLLPGSAEWLRFRPTGELRAGEQLYAAVVDGGLQLDNGVVERRFLPHGVAVVAADGEPLWELTLGYGGDGRIVQIGDWPVTYDGNSVSSVGRVGVEHDDAGNLMSVGPVTFEHDGTGRVIAMAIDDEMTAEFAYDGDGNRTRSGETHFRYDGKGQLREVRTAGGPVTRYGYDGFGRKVWRDHDGRVTVLHRDVDGNVLAETDAAGQATATYLWAGGRCLGQIDGEVGRPVARWFHADHRGTTWLITDATGQPVWRHAGTPLDPPAEGLFGGKLRDSATGLFDFLCRDYDPVTRRFLSPDEFTFGPDDPRLREAGPDVHAAWLEVWGQHPEAGNPYAYCLGDPVNLVDPDGHSAWWFFLTIPSSLTWALPNTVAGVIIGIGNFLMEIIGWIIWLFGGLGRGWGLDKYPWGAGNNAFDPAERDHIFFDVKASARLGVPWALVNGSFFTFGNRPYTMGNVILNQRTFDNALAAEPDGRYVVPNDPDTQLSQLDALYAHEMQHTFQYALLGPLFHMLPASGLSRAIRALRGQDVSELRWWERINIGDALGLTFSSLLWLLTFGKINRAEFHDTITRWINPATWFSQLPPGWVKLASEAVSFQNWIPPGIYEWDLIFRGGQEESWFERNAGANSGNTYKSVVEVEDDELFAGQFTRVVVANRAATPTPGMSLAAPGATWGVSPAVAVPLGALPPAAVDPHIINFNSVNAPPVSVMNANGIYFHALPTTQTTFTVRGTMAGESENVEITVKPVSVVPGPNVALKVCQSVTFAIGGDSAGLYGLQFLGSAAGAINGFTYTAGSAPATDTLEVVVTYPATAAPFDKYGDNGLAGTPQVVATITVTVTDVTIVPAVATVSVGESLILAADLAPSGGSSTALVPGSLFNPATMTFRAGPGSIAAQQVETITLNYACRNYTVNVAVNPIVVLASPASVAAGGTSSVSVVSGGTSPFGFAITAAGSSGPSIDSATGAYRAGTTGAPTQDIITVTDANGGRGNVIIQVTP